MGTNESIPISQILFLLYIFQNEAHKDWKLTPEQAKTLLSSYETLSDEQKKMVSTDIVQKLYELRDQKFEQKMEIDD